MSATFLQNNEGFAQFVLDVQQNYTYSESTVENNSIIVKVNNKTLAISSADLLSRYNAFKNSALPYKGWVTRTVGYITHLVEKWIKS